jgi:zinc transport system substrate-binding protein
MHFSTGRFGLAVLATTVLIGCSRGPVGEDAPSSSAETEAAAITVYVVNYPLKYFAERIGGTEVRVVFPAPADEDPAFWTPDPETIAAYQQADLILLNGASYAKWTAIASLPQTRTVDTSASFADQYIEINDAVTHTHGPGGEHAHGEMAFTTWLDPRLAVEQARAITDALSVLRPDLEKEFMAGFSRLERDLLELDAALEKAFTAANDAPLVFSHPVYQYLERRYALDGRSVHWEPDEPPSESQWEELSELLVSHPAKWMVWEGEPAEATVARLRAAGLGSVVFDPCGNTPETGDYLAVMQQNAARVSEALRDQDH